MTLFIGTIFLICFILGHLRLEYQFSENANRYLRLVIILLLIVAAGFRDGLSGYRDYQNYIWAFQAKEVGSVEYSFILVSYIAQWLGGGNYYYLFLIYAILGVYIKYIAIKNLTPLVWFSLAIYVSYFYSLHELTQIRAGVASGIGLLSLRFVYEKRFIPFVILILLATFFHTSALLYLPLYLLDGKKINWKKWCVGIIAIAMFYDILAENTIIFFLKYFPEGLAQDKIKGYMERGMQGTDNVAFSGNMYFLSCLLLGIFILFANRIQFYNKYFYLLLKVYVFGFLVKFIFSETIPELSNRGSELLSVVSIILIPMVIYIAKPRIIGILFIFAVGGAYLYYILYSWKIIP